MGATDIEERTILDNRFGSGTPATWYFGLTTTVPNDDGTNVTEPVGGSYARVAVTNNVTNFPAASTSGGITSKSNGTAVTFANPTGNWGKIVGYVIADALSGGNIRYVDRLKDGAEITVNSGATPVQFPAGSLILRAD